MAMCGLFVFILLVIANFYGGDSQPSRDPLCTYDADGNVICYEASRRSLNKDSSSGIAHGEETDILEHPYMLALEYNGFGICGATISGPRWAVTAAHCVDKQNVEIVQLRALSNELERGGVTFRISKIFLHPEYDKETFANDIALLRVTKPFLETDSRLAAINLPQQDEELPVGTMVTVLGWGYTEDGVKSDHLRRVEIPIKPIEVCDSEYKGTNSDLMICAGAEGGKIACGGDSGGPAVFDNTLYGIVSFGRTNGVCPLDLMGLTKVAAYREWIEEMQEYEDL